ncbi:hypothetical protein [Streptomyces sp. SCL15-4]|uniref:hypothetical protein n=1 Tax=Streptomyces sp. SCL15-4 TaxID=2967221 RepID=UPI002966743E|nr:hypothetical protein [Streptomyces sp. SCL15-4]
MNLAFAIPLFLLEAAWLALDSVYGYGLEVNAGAHEYPYSTAGAAPCADQGNHVSPRSTDRTRGQQLSRRDFSAAAFPADWRTQGHFTLGSD